MFNEEWGEVYFELAFLKTEMFKRFSNGNSIAVLHKTKKAVSEWLFVFCGLSVPFWVFPPMFLSSDIWFVIQFILSWLVIVFTFSLFSIIRKIRAYQKLASKIYQLDKRLRNTPQKLNETTPS